MWFYSFIFLLLLLINCLAYLKKNQKLGYVLSIILLIIVAAFRPSSCCADYGTYQEYYYNLADIPLTFLEPAFFAISWLSKIIFNGPIGVFLIYSILGVGLKGWALPKLTKYYCISLILYYCSFFLLHEMTQIRVGVASGILLLSIPYIEERRPYKFLGLMLIGILFHYSLIVFVFCYFINPNEIKRVNYILLIIAVYFITLAGINFISVLQYINLGFLSNKIATYQALLKQGIFGNISLINPLLYLRICILFFFIINNRLLAQKNRYGIILIKIYAFSILAFIGLSALPILAGRVSQLLGIVEIVLVPCGVYILKPKYLAVIMFVCFALMIMYKQLYYSDLMTGYF